MVRSRLEMALDILDATRTRHVKNKILIAANINKDAFPPFERKLLDAGLIKILDGERFLQYHLTERGRQIVLGEVARARRLPGYEKLPRVRRGRANRLAKGETAVDQSDELLTVGPLRSLESTAEPTKET